MNWFLNLKTSTKVVVVLGLELVLLVLLAVVAVYDLRGAQVSTRTLHEVQFRNALDVSAMTAMENMIRGDLFKMVALRDPALQRVEYDDIQQLSGEVDGITSALRERNSTDTEFLSLLDAWESVRGEFIDVREEKVVRALFNGNASQALEIALGEQVARLQEMRVLASDLVLLAETKASGAVDAAEARTRGAIVLFVVVAAIAIGLTLATIFLMNRALTQPLKALTDVAAQVANRDLTVSLQAEPRSDEVGTLQSTFRQMIVNLRSVTMDVTDGIGVLASSSSEIMASSSQVAAGAAETASAISETTSTVEEVRQTATMTTQKAKDVSERSQQAKDVAQTGSEAMHETVDGMRGVRHQMEAIADSITRLSEHGQSIGAIIATVDDIAEQSNLLAVNAAIEAAKAGDQGSGFAIVAQEMRSLAEQSKDATKQVRQILNDIQRGVSQAGMATEQGARAVETGITRTEEAGATIQALLDTVKESAQVAVQIAAASQQQLAGMEQVATAMENVRDASEQNATATRQMEESARALKDLGRRMQELVGQYKV